jgi:hypothetical protein
VTELRDCGNSYRNNNAKISFSPGMNNKYPNKYSSRYGNLVTPENIEKEIKNGANGNRKL